MQAAMRRISSSRASSSSGSPFASCRKVNFSDSNTTVSTTDSAQISKKPKRITKDERRLMVESVVDKYRATNAGKFPNTSFVRQEVGGRHYTIREILQELKYKSKHNICSSSQELRLVETFDNCKHQEPLELVDDLPDQKGEKCDGLHMVDRSKIEELQLVDTSEISPAVSPESFNHREPLNFSDLCDGQMQKSSVHCDESRGRIAENFDGLLLVDQEVRVSGRGGVMGEPVVEIKDTGGVNGPGGKCTLEFSEDNGPHKEDVPRNVEHKESTVENPSVWENLTSMARGIISFFTKA